MFYNIYFLHACLILYNLPIFVLHNIVFNVLSDNKYCCYKLLLLHKYTMFMLLKLDMRVITYRTTADLLRRNDQYAAFVISQVD